MSGVGTKECHHGTNRSPGQNQILGLLRRNVAGRKSLPRKQIDKGDYTRQENANVFEVQ